MRDPHFVTRHGVSDVFILGDVGVADDGELERVGKKCLEDVGLDDRPNFQNADPELMISRIATVFTKHFESRR